MRHTLFAAVAAVGLMVASAASAQMVHYSAKLAGAAGVKGSGEVTAMLDGKTFTYSATYKDLTGPAVAAHFHTAAPGANGPPALGATVSPSPIKGTATLNDTQIADLNAGKWYFNLHTAANPGGEIRGTVTAMK
ncbi:CHRD domain-containing protein [Phenylobacterium sp.]|uniref:CHRD domain-containing protein n=1 Tax=Phenylobacterium sp. TaxID=1871053 RepID=UPI0035658014